jgi:REP element-mobilizing transposase RayT
MTRTSQTIAFWRGRLPHWEVVDGRYFVTIHLAGAIPPAGQKRIRQFAARYEQLAEGDDNGRLRLNRLIYAEMEAWLDRAGPVSHLQRPEVARVIVEAISHREGHRWNMFEYVVMPSHVHLFFELLQPGLKDCLEQFKRWTGHQAAKVAGLDGLRFWQDEWFDHWSRSDEEDDRIIKYMRRNPEKAGLVENHLDWPYGSWAK